MTNLCLTCDATRQYPSGRVLVNCPRCGSPNIRHFRLDQLELSSSEIVIKAIDGTLVSYLKALMEPK